MTSSRPNAIVLIAHEPLATALRSTAEHILPTLVGRLHAVDVAAQLTLQENRERAVHAVRSAGRAAGVLLLSDIVGATPCNIAAWLLQDLPQARLISGVNLPMLLRALTYSGEPLDVLALRALDGGVTGVMDVQVAGASRDAGGVSHDS